MEQCKKSGIDTKSKNTYKSFLKADDIKALKDYLKERLNDCGWHEKIEKLIQIKLKKHDKPYFTRQEIINIIIPHAQALVPDAVRKEMKVRMRNVLYPENPVTDKN